jgi:hypothetical protein
MPADLFDVAEAAYHLADRHWSTCPTCGPAGGETALDEEMCDTGRHLTLLWDVAERNAAREAEAV